MANTFSLILPISVIPSGRATNVHTGPKGWMNAATSLSGDSDLIAAITYINGVNPGGLTFTGTDGTTPATGLIQYSGDINDEIIQISLPNSLVSFLGLPAGFVMQSATLTILDIDVNPTDAGGVTINSVAVTINLGSASATSNYSNVGNHVHVGDLSVSLDMSAAPTMLNLVTDGWGLEVTITTNNPFVSNPSTLTVAAESFASSYSITGTYAILSAKWTLVTPANLINPGDPITITSPPGGLDLTQINTINVQYVDDSGDVQTLSVASSSFITQTVNELVFLSPDFTDAPLVHINAVSDGFQFSGSVLLGSLLTINFTDASGVYQLVPGKATDTLYIQQLPGTTADVKIPNPFIKTGYLP